MSAPSQSDNRVWDVPSEQTHMGYEESTFTLVGTW
jgi:hypothetical protein